MTGTERLSLSVQLVERRKGAASEQNGSPGREYSSREISTISKMCFASIKGQNYVIQLHGRHRSRETTRGGSRDSDFERWVDCGGLPFGVRIPDGQKSNRHLETPGRRRWATKWYMGADVDSEEDSSIQARREQDGGFYELERHPATGLVKLIGRRSLYRLEKITQLVGTTVVWNLNSRENKSQSGFLQLQGTGQARRRSFKFPRPNKEHKQEQDGRKVEENYTRRFGREMRWGLTTTSEIKPSSLEHPTRLSITLRYPLGRNPHLQPEAEPVQTRGLRMVPARLSSLVPKLFSRASCQVDILSLIRQPRQSRPTLVMGERSVQNARWDSESSARSRGVHDTAISHTTILETPSSIALQF
ncbi:hypothetical protein FB451DRAFT_1163634 [Mycena latifolia]|nr:hypothetical protein FB451DRAFT_1163634 [Mycena latifolia]